MSFWNGTFAKHRDYEHDSFFDHMVAGSGSYDVGKGTVLLDYDPMGDVLDEPEDFTPVRLVSHGKSYTYFVPGSNPSRDEIKEYLDKWNSSKVPEDGRDLDYMLTDPTSLASMDWDKRNA